MEEIDKSGMGGPVWELELEWGGSAAGIAEESPTRRVHVRPRDADLKWSTRMQLK